MSSTLSTIFSAASTVGDLLNGPTLTLGSVGFQDFEVPEKITWGGEQMLNVHQLVGGGRVIDSMGPSDRNLDWSGYFRGENAVSRARSIDAIRRAGAKVALRFVDFSYQVVIQRFECTYQLNGYLLPYSISCVVVPSAGTAAAKPSLLQQLGVDVSSALGLPSLAADVQSALSTVQSALPLAAVLTGGSAAFVSLSSTVAQAQGVVSTGQSLVDGQLGASISSGIGSLSDAAARLGNLSGSLGAGAFLGRVASNIAGKAA